MTFSVVAAILVGGIFGLLAVADQRNDDGPAALLQPDPPLTAEPEADVVAFAGPQLRPWLEPAGVPLPVDDSANPDEPRRAQLEQCRLEQGTMASIAMAFITQTRSVPDDPDVIESTWLHEVPDSWNNEWDFKVVGGGLIVVPRPGGACDL